MISFSSFLVWQRLFASASPYYLPAMSPTMTEGKIVEWAVKEGDSVEPGDLLFEMQTDKATLEVEADKEMIIAKILVLPFVSPCF